MVLQSRGNEAASFFRCLCFDRPRTEVAQHIDTPFADHLFGDLMDCRENAADAARRALVRNGAVCDREMSLFDETVPIDLQLDVFYPGRRAPREGRFDQRLQDMPDLPPAIR